MVCIRSVHALGANATRSAHATTPAAMARRRYLERQESSMMMPKSASRSPREQEPATAPAMLLLPDEIDDEGHDHELGQGQLVVPLDEGPGRAEDHVIPS